jgi:hypothetical protein
MDDHFELPSAATHAPVSGDPRPDEHDELEDDDEDGGPDWTNLPYAHFGLAPLLLIEANTLSFKGGRFVHWTARYT